MLSRVADSIYWLNRLIERAENLARVIDVNLNLMLDLPPDIKGEQWEPIVQVTADLPLFREHFDAATKENVIEFLAFFEPNPSSILRCVGTARENARSVREAISSEMWGQINEFYLLVRSAGFQGLITGEPHAFFNRIRTESHLFYGITDATMPHSEGWHFGRLGRMIERADKTSRILDVKYFILLPSVTDVGTPFDSLQWSALLRSASALEAYRKRHGRITPTDVAEFLILDREFPRSINHCLTKAEESLRTITGSPVGTFQTVSEQLLGRLRSRLAFISIGEIIAGGLHEFLDDLQRDLNAVGDAIFERFFALRPAEELAVMRRSLRAAAASGEGA